MSNEDILINLNKFKDNKDEVEKEIRKLEEQLEHIYELRNNYKSCKDKFNYNMVNRRKNLETIGSLASKVTIANSYYLKMNDVINGSRFNSISNKVEDIEFILGEKIEKTKCEITDLKQKKQNYDSQIDTLSHKLNKN